MILNHGALMLFLLSLLAHSIHGQKVITPDLGTLLGSVTQTAWTAKPIYQFLGVRYAKSPSGSRRFQAPELAIPNPGVHNVQKYGRPCTVLEYYQNMTAEELSGDIEDCLHLSIYSGNLSANNPVMVYIHGGTFFRGTSSQHPPNYLLEKDIVLVVPQYRLGPLGFLSTKTNDIPGNAGLLDVIMALKWIKSYIHHFGGDPTKITAIGQSVGSTLISTILLIPSIPEDLFQRAILQSGSAVSMRSIDFEPEDNAKDIAKFGGCHETDDLEEINQCFKDMNVVVMLKAFHKHLSTRSIDGFTHSGGAKLTVGGPNNHILKMLPFELLQTQSRKNVSVMAGVVKHDGTFILSIIYDFLAKAIDINNNTLNSFHLVDKITDFLGVQDPTGAFSGFLTNKLFTHDQMIRGNFTDMIPGIIDAFGTIGIKAPLFRIVQSYAQAFPEQTYMYSFDYEGEHTAYGLDGDITNLPFDGGVYHYNENLYVFPYPPYATKLNEDDKKMSKIMIDLLSSFAATGIPSSNDLPVWPPVTKISGPYLHINKVGTIGDDFLDEYSVAARENGRSIRLNPNRNS